ncbi:MAG: hypothetical protein QFX40_01925 [Archaeoglobales archaeon]|nr:hypothetical protein [Archaeoglobales archaeon]
MFSIFIEKLIAIYIAVCLAIQDSEIPSKKEVLHILSEFVEELEKMGVRIKITLESDKFLKKVHVKPGEMTPEKAILMEELKGIDLDEWYYDKIEEDRIYIEPDEKLIEVLRKMWPLIFVGGTQEGYKENFKWIESYIVVSSDFEREKVKCPFCEHEQEYLSNYEGLSIPSQCECGARVNVLTELDAYDKITFKGDNFMAESDGKIHLGVRVGDFYFVFTKKLIELSAEDIKKASEGLLIKGAPIKGNFEYKLKEAKRMSYRKFYNVFEKLERLKLVDVVFGEKGRGKTRYVYPSFNRKILVKAMEMDLKTHLLL